MLDWDCLEERRTPAAPQTKPRSGEGGGGLLASQCGKQLLGSFTWAEGNSAEAIAR